MTAVKLSDQRGTGGGRSDRRCTVSAVKDEALGANGQPAYVQVKLNPQLDSCTLCFASVKSSPYCLYVIVW